MPYAVDDQRDIAGTEQIAVLDRRVRDRVGPEVADAVGADGGAGEDADGRADAFRRGRGMVWREL
ncbi:hypothetical protein [Streptomyces sp. PA5.6]|uniref:hypothetical protein n=1 Tax=Streptomyces sp. PA5.6 TaxID=3035651 RepID=UPI003904DEF7